MRQPLAWMDLEEALKLANDKIYEIFLKGQDDLLSKLTFNPANSNPDLVYEKDETTITLG